MPDEILKINMLGEFSLTYNGKTISDQSNRSKKLWVLLEYLITFREKEISQNDLVDLLWPDDEISNPLNTLKTLLHRARASVAELGFSGGKDLVVARRGTYAWNTSIPLWVDTDQFDAYCRQADAAENAETKLELLTKALDLYKGDFLPKSALEPWAVPIGTYYHSQYIKVVHTVLQLLSKSNRYAEAIGICQKAVVIDPYEESFHKELIQALVRTNSPQAAMKHYEYVTELFFDQFGVTPSEELTSIYREIVKTESAVELDLGVIKTNLAEAERVPGAFFCEYEFFKDIYKLNSRSCARNGQVIQIALLTVVDRSGDSLGKKQLKLAMNHLKDIICTSLRRGDVFTRCSISQYLLMLPAASLENSQNVLDRIVRNYRRQYPKSPGLIQYKLLPLDPEF